MKATINRKLFLDQALPLSKTNDISLMLHAGVLSVASFGNNINFRVPAYVIESGQAFMTADEWQELVMDVQAKKEPVFELELNGNNQTY